jgi:hypothetical protein
VNAPGDTFDFKAELTSEPTAPEAGHIKVFSQVDFNATTEPTAAAMGAFDFTRDAKAGGMAPADPELELFCDGSVRPEGQGDPNLLLPAVDDGGYVIDWTPVDPTNPNADLSDGQYVLTGLQHNLPAVQAPADDGLLLV